MTGPPTLLRSGKVRDLYEAGRDTLLMVASDRVSAFDVVFAEPIPEKGRVLTAMTAFWCDQVTDVVENALLSADPSEIAGAVAGVGGLGDISGRAMLVRRAEMIPLECIVRGYLAGQAFEEYARFGTVHAMSMPAGLRLADPLPEPLFTPSTKAEVGHDENIDFAAAASIVGSETATEVREICLALYERAARRAAEAGFILADTKFELGRIQGRLVLCDEVVTPDSSRLWPADEVVPGSTPPSFDKQPLRDWAASQSWDRTPPPPALPPEVVSATSERYVAAYERVTGRSLADWYGPA
ncbi:MAG TPA: phosphoribosylaminoimidazolesuccinocarboxamide synthase [Acidimicrobiales bacterium]|nr:phosphoribosylaminoimidazolesuccinocarboxamide synthase [Acidimicrobiales bacterium]